MLAIFIAQLKLCTHFEFATAGEARFGLRQLKSARENWKSSIFLYLSVSSAILKLSPHFIPSPVRSPQSVFYTDRSWNHNQYLPALLHVNWPFGVWASWKRGQSPHQFPAERRPLQKSSGANLESTTEKISNFSALQNTCTGHPKQD